VVSQNDGESLLIEQEHWQVLDHLSAEAKALEKDGEEDSIIKNPYDSSKDESYYYVYPLNFDGIAWGWIHIGFKLDVLDNAYKTMYLKMFLLFTFVFIIISIAIFFVTKQIVNPIIALSHATKEMTRGELEVQLISERADEIGELTQNFNIMAQGLSKIQNELKNTNAMLEEKVALRTRELEEINKTLDHRVQVEIAHRREQEQILIQQSRFAAMGEMIGNIAHQWRQPLNALALLLQNISIAYETGRMDAAFISRVNEKGLLLTNTMSTTIDDFRNFFKPNREKEFFSVDEQIDKTLAMLQASLDTNLIEVKRDLKPGLKIYGFANEFTQVIINILNNAKDALIENKQERCTICIKSYEDSSHVYVTILDNAGGIDDAVIDNIFDPYFTTKDQGKGTGIGLYMSKAIIENNIHGKLYVKNEAQGALFTIAIEKNDTQKSSFNTSKEKK
jgi:C4-dicarboxylate-specific signal transduction histidine kinase